MQHSFKANQFTVYPGITLVDGRQGTASLDEKRASLAVTSIFIKWI